MNLANLSNEELVSHVEFNVYSSPLEKVLAKRLASVIEINRRYVEAVEAINEVMEDDINNNNE